MHWPVQGNVGNPACSVENLNATEGPVNISLRGASLYIFAGDTNEGDLLQPQTTSDWMPWYKQANAALGGAFGYRDPIYYSCGGSKACSLTHHTLPNRRVDMIFASKGTQPAMGRIGTVSTSAAQTAAGSTSGLPYSDHLAVHANIYY